MHDIYGQVRDALEDPDKLKFLFAINNQDPLIYSIENEISEKEKRMDAFRGREIILSDNEVSDLQKKLNELRETLDELKQA